MGNVTYLVARVLLITFLVTFLVVVLVVILVVRELLGLWCLLLLLELVFVT
jgi:hypothetical protein